jgi:Putative restriction endonuclease
MSTAQSLLPPLREGDRLTPAEFLRRWEAMPDVRKAELIEGIVYMPSPVGTGHGRGDSMMICWMVIYAAATPGCEVLNNTSWSMTPKSLPQPDAALHILPEYGGQTRDKSNHIVGVPELVVEICESSAAYDLGPKLRLYQKAGVREYITALFGERQIIWRELFEGRYREIFPDNDGLLRSRVFPGLCLDPEAALALDLARVLETLHQALASPEHANFVLNLANRKRRL